MAKKGFSQKLGASKGVGGIKSKSARAAQLAYKGYSQSPGVSHGSMGALSSAGKKRGK